MYYNHESGSRQSRSQYESSASGTLSVLKIQEKEAKSKVKYHEVKYHEMKHHEWIYRILFYLLGLVILAFGISLNTKAGLGVSAIISVSYSISEVSGISFGNTTLGLYILFIILEIILHSIRDKRYEKCGDRTLEHAKRKDRKLVVLMDILQFPLSIVFTRFLDVFSVALPDFSQFGTPGAVRMTVRFTVLILAIILTGIGAAMSLNMRIIPNPGDGIVQAVADCIRKDVGFTKNCVDVFNILISTSIGLIFVGHLVGVGIGTVFAVIGVGRAIAVFNHFAYDRMVSLAGVEQ